MAASPAFYRALGVPIADGQDEQPHVDAQLEDGVTLAWNTIETIRSFEPAYQPHDADSLQVDCSIDRGCFQHSSRESRREPQPDGVARTVLLCGDPLRR